MSFLPVRRPALLAAIAMALMVVAAACAADEPTATPRPTYTPAPTYTPGPVPSPTPNLTPGQGVTVQPARATWTTGYINEAIVGQLLEELGYDVADFQELANPLFYQSASLGDVDYWANGWFPLHQQYEDTYSGKAQIAGTIVETAALQGYLADKKTVSELGIETLEDFKRQEVKDAFDTNGDGKADLYGCPPGWGCHDHINFHLSDLGLEDHINHVTAGYSINFAEAVARVNNGEPVLYYTWTPSGFVYKLPPGEDVTWVGVPRASHPQGLGASVLTAQGIPCAADPCMLGFAANDIAIFANNDFLEQNPIAATLFSEVKVPFGALARINNRYDAGENTQADVDRMAREWIATNRDKVDEWLNAARMAGS